MKYLYRINNRIFKIKKTTDNSPQLCGTCIRTNYSCLNFTILSNNEEVNECYFLDRVIYEEIIDPRESLLLKLQSLEIKDLKFILNKNKKDISSEILESILKKFNN